MQKILLIFTTIFLVSVSSNLFALEKGSWTLTKDNDWCYIGSLPIKSDLILMKRIVIYLKIIVTISCSKMVYY